MTDRVPRRLVEPVAREQRDRSAAELAGQLACLRHELERRTRRLAVARSRRPTRRRSGRQASRRRVAASPSSRRAGRARRGVRRRPRPPRPRSPPGSPPARASRRRTASTRVGDPGWPKRRSFSVRSSTRSAAVQTSTRPAAGSTSCSSLRADRDDCRQLRLDLLLAAVDLARYAQRGRRRGSRESALTTCGQARNAATSGGTCQVSESTVLRPVSARSTPPSLRRASASVRDVPRVSATAKTRSLRWIARSAPERERLLQRRLRRTAGPSSSSRPLRRLLSQCDGGADGGAVERVQDERDSLPLQRLRLLVELDRLRDAGPA